jgi:hypothetical protein
MANDIDNKISELRRKAAEQGLSIRFRNTPTDQGDFCIFIKDPTYRPGYAVGFDGDWQSKAVSFDQCLASAYHWLEKRDKRFTFRDGRWQYGHYHFIVWKDRDGRDMNYYLTIEDADKAAAEYVSQGCCVVCYDEPPSGKSTLAKVYGEYLPHVNDYVRRSIEKWSKQ